MKVYELFGRSHPRLSENAQSVWNALETSVVAPNSPLILEEIEKGDVLTIWNYTTDEVVEPSFQALHDIAGMEVSDRLVQWLGCAGVLKALCKALAA